MVITVKSVGRYRQIKYKVGNQHGFDHGGAGAAFSIARQR